jgi:hypothetical protein
VAWNPLCSFVAYILRGVEQSFLSGIRETGSIRKDALEKHQSQNCFLAYLSSTSRSVISFSLSGWVIRRVLFPILSVPTLSVRLEMCMAGGMTVLREPEVPGRKVFKCMRPKCPLLPKDVAALASNSDPVEDCRELSLL